MKKQFLTLSLFSALFLAIFNTANAACLSPTNLSATNRVGTSVKLNWGKVNGATKYQFQLESTGSTPYLWQSSTIYNGNVTSYVKTGLAISRNYRFRIRAFCSDGIWTPWSNYLSFNSGGWYKPGTSDEDGSIAISATDVSKTAAVLNWPNFETATKYQVQVSGFWGEDYMVKQSTVVSNSFKTENLTPGHDYIYRVRAYDPENGWGGWSIEQEFTTQESAVETAEPKLWASNTTQFSADLNWEKIDAASAYQIQVSPISDEDFSVHQFTFRENTKTSFKMTELESEKTYEFRLRTADEDGEWGEWTEFSAFSTEERGKQVAAISTMDVQVSPNPAVDLFDVKINSEIFADRQLTLISPAGQVVRTANLDAGQNSQIFQVDDLAAGLYFLRIESAGTQQTQKVVIHH